MKYVFLFLFLLGSSFTAVAQAPQGIPYQGAARNSSGGVLANTSIRVRISIHDSIATGSLLYCESFSVTTSSLGLFNVNIGTGTPSTGTFSAINWGTNAKFVQTEIDPAGGTSYIDLGTIQLMSVPYALYAGNVKTYIAGPGVSLSGDTISSAIAAFDSTKPTFNIGFSGSSTWTCPSGVTKIVVQLWGAGAGGGGGAFGSNSAYGSYGCGAGIFVGGSGGSGGSGGYIKKVLNVTPGNTYSIIVGGGGSGGNGGGGCGGGGACPYPYPGSGTDGGVSSFNGIIAADGGTAGGAGSSSSGGGCANGGNGTNGAISNFTPATYSSPYTSSPRSFIPSGYLTATLIPNNSAGGGNGGAGGVGIYTGSPSYSSGTSGGGGESGFCVISY